MQSLHSREQAQMVRLAPHVFFRPMAGKSKSKDAITGMTLRFNDTGKIKTDEVYKVNSRVTTLLLSTESQEFRSSLSSFESEIELSPDYLVVTYKLRSSSPDSPQETTARAVLQGQYKYLKGKILSARIDNIAQDSFSIKNGQSYNYGYVKSFDGGIAISNPSLLSSFLVATKQQGREVAIYDYLPPGSVGYNGTMNETSDYIVVGDRSSVTSFGSDRFLQVGWHSNPFGINLL